MNGFVIERLNAAGECVGIVRGVPRCLAGRHVTTSGVFRIVSIFTSLDDALDFADALGGSLRVVARRRV